MGKFGNLKVSELCLKLTNAARAKSQTEELRAMVKKDGLIAIGIQPLSDEAKKWSGIHSGGKIALHCHSLDAEGNIGSRFCERLEGITSDMEASAKDRELHVYQDEWLVDSDIGSAISVEIRDSKTNDLHMRISAFVSGDVSFARECCFAVCKEIDIWLLSCHDESDRRTLWTPAAWRDARAFSADAAIAS